MSDEAAPEEHPSEHPREVDTTQVSTAFDRRRTIVGGLVTVAVLAVVFVGIIPTFGSYSEAWDEIRAMPGGALGALVGSTIVTILVFVLPYQAAIPGLGYRPAFLIRQTSFTISNAVPAGGALGLALQYVMLSSYSVSTAAATAGIAVTSIWSVLVTLTLPVFGVLAALADGRLDRGWVWIGLAGLAVTALTVVGLYLILRSEASAIRLGSLAQRMLEPLNRRRANPWDARAMVLDLRHATAGVLTRHWARVTSTNFLVLLAQFSVLWFAIAGIGGADARALSLAGALAAFAISRMASMIPLTPGGLGTVDAALIALLVTFGLPQGVALAATLVWRAASFVPQVVLGALTFLVWRVEEARAARG